MSFDPYNRLLKIQKSIGTPTRKEGAHSGVWGFIPSHSFANLGAKNVTLELTLSLHLVNPCFGCKPKARVTTILMSTMHDLSANDIVVRYVIKGIEGAHVVRLTL
jgi:hypothetical protein